MSGYGESEYGGSEYGIGDFESSPTAGSILVYPSTANIGDPVIVANTTAGSTFLDDSRDDAFSASMLDALAWSTSTSGSVVNSTGSGLLVELRKNGGGSAFSITSSESYVDGNVCVDYEILSQSSADNPLSTLTYASLDFIFGLNTSLSIARVMIPGINGHQILVQLTVNGQLAGSSTYLTTSTSGRLRLAKFGNTLIALHDERILFQARNTTLGAFNTRILTSTNGQSEYVKVKFRDYRSQPGVLFGDAFMSTVTILGVDRINGEVAASESIGPVKVTVFNHTGEMVYLTDGFTYPLLLGAALSPNGGIVGNIQEDKVLR